MDTNTIAIFAILAVVVIVIAAAFRGSISAKFGDWLNVTGSNPNPTSQSVTKNKVGRDATVNNDVGLTQVVSENEIANDLDVKVTKK